MEMELPGFRFHPTEEELLDFYLKNTILGNNLRFDIIGFLNIYHHDPWDLPRLAKVGEREWYFLVGREKKQGSGGRPNRTTKKGFWKATGSERKIISLSEPKRLIGLRKTLVFYRGRAPRGSKTDWVMNEYRLPDHKHNNNDDNDIVLCKIYRKATSLKVLEQRAAAIEHDSTTDQASPTTTSSSSDYYYSSLLLKQEPPLDHDHKAITSLSSSSSKDDDSRIIGELHQLPLISMDWTQHPFCSQFNSPSSLLN